MSDYHTSPLEIVQHELWRHTDRNPADSEAVRDLIGEAALHFNTPEQPHADKDFLWRIAKGLDPDTPGGLGVTGVTQIEELGQVATDETETRAKQWGALSLLGALATTHEPELASLDTDAEPALQRAQLGSIVARRALAGIAESSHTSNDKKSLANALLAHSGVPTQDVALELTNLLTPKITIREITREDIPRQRTAEDIPTVGAAVGEPRDCLLAPISPEAQDKLDRMNWLSDDFDPYKETLEGRDIFHDGKKIATVLNLTVGNTTLKKIHNELVDSQVGDLVWPLIATSVVKLVTDNKIQPLVNSKVHTLVARKPGNNANLIRAYYAPLGTHPDGTRIFGLIAACRTKEHGFTVMRLIANGNRKV